MKLSQSELDKIQSAIAEVERKTSGEIVTVVVKRSDSYLFMPLLGALFGDAMVSVFMLLTSGSSLSFGDFSSLYFAMVQAVGLLGGAILFSIPWVQRIFLRENVFFHAVQRAAEASFVQQGLHHTKNETGILLYISLHEHRVQILADRGIHRVVGNEYWKNEVASIVRGIRSGKFIDSVCETVLRMGETLAKNFPPTPDDTNELSDRVRTD